ncbi:YqzH family protein [Bacillus sp. DX4.1]|uniref:YqzH family protein n=1 Tax=Bacillus sp. DX4.1 TaxID=3055867 RepID=UPI0025A15558|nr:YqzH family protein [Bacillus sp. DX4.1]MDM5189843.1 YqzH family protein [Bacillus sp. DX4.1]
MNEKLIGKMMIKSFGQYQCKPISEKDYEVLIQSIKTMICTHPDIDVYEAIEDIVYEYITGT